MASTATAALGSTGYTLDGRRMTSSTSTTQQQNSAEATWGLDRTKHVHEFLKTKHRVGSVHAGVNYNTSDSAFHATDIPAKALAAKIDIKLNALERDRNRWRSETSLDRPQVERRTLENFAYDPTEYSYNFRAEVLPKARPVIKDAFGRISKLVLDSNFKRTQEMPTHPDLATEETSLKRRWDLGTQLLEGEKKKALDTLTKRSLSVSRVNNARLRASSPKPAPSLLSREEMRMETLRANREQGHQVHSTESLQNIHEHTLAWTANIRNAATLHEPFVPAIHPSPRAAKNPSEELFVETYQKIQSAHEKTLQSTYRSRTVMKFKHSGVFQVEQQPLVAGTRSTSSRSNNNNNNDNSNHQNDDEYHQYEDEEGHHHPNNNNDNSSSRSNNNNSGRGGGLHQHQAQYGSKPRRMWSCCGSSDPGAKGCVPIKHDPDRWTYGP